jgi:protein TonB
VNRPVQPRPQTNEPPKFTAPVEVPEEIVPEEGIDLGVEGGVPGGVEGGVPGGVVGGVVGGLPDAPPPQQAVRVGGQIKEPKKLKDVKPVYPDIAKQARVQGVVILECTISPQGKVTDVKVLRGIPLLDAAAIDAVKQWVYTPTLLNGVPVPVIMTVTVNFRLS